MVSMPHLCRRLDVHHESTLTINMLNAGVDVFAVNPEEIPIVCKQTSNVTVAKKEIIIHCCGLAWTQHELLPLAPITKAGTHFRSLHIQIAAVECT
mmetsp:Transcript_81102/g.262134  ORF Transcript_81102/g.262134 Transcript_81102/m.262134 type:complete len:96 (+) Transcript_81102:1179-1466(+)